MQGLGKKVTYAERKRATFLILLVFNVTPFKIDENKKYKPFSRLSLESGNRKKVDMQRLAEIQDTAIFLTEDMRRNFLPNL